MKIIIDTETGGFNNKENALLSIGYVVIDDNLNIKEKGEIKIKSGNLKAEKTALEINKINLEEHNAIADTEEQAINTLNTVINAHFGNDKPVVIGHNVRFDTGFIGALYKRNNCKFVYNYGLIDTMEITRVLNALNKTGLKSAKLDDIRAHYGIKGNGQAHSAMTDCLDTLEYLKILNNKIPVF